MELHSPAFANNAPIPARFTGDGDDVTPQLVWSGIPNSAKELALIVDDPDAPRPAPWVHWVIYRIPASLGGLPENISKITHPTAPAGVAQGKNSWNVMGYRGPSPPRGHGVHHYHFRLYALDINLSEGPGLEKDRLLDIMKGHIVAQSELIGTYQR